MGGLRVAIDLGAGSGRALVGRITPDGVSLREAHRFHYPPRAAAGRLRWDSARLFEGLGVGLAKAVALAASQGSWLESVGVDSWGVDYGLVDAAGQLVEEPVCYRDPRTDGVMEQVFALVPRAELFERTGIQFLSLNTLYQLFAHARHGLPAEAERLLLVPDLCHHFLCGATSGERTNASTTQLLNLETGGWDDSLFARLSLPRALMPDLVPAGTRLGRLRRERRSPGMDALEVIAPATHDTASAVAGTPLQPGWAYVSSGTWSLVGLERESPLVGAAVERANLTNEAGACGTVRVLKNVMGLWILESCREEWARAGRGGDLEPLLDAVAAVPGFVGFVFPDDPRFFSPASMTHEIRSALQSTGQPTPDDPVRLAKLILDSLALRYASVVRTLEALTGDPIPGLHIVGGGSRNRYLNQATADACGRPVLAGPVEATAAGNLLVQSIAADDVATLAEGRALLARAFEPARYEPRAAVEWLAAAERYAEIEAAAGP